MNWQISCPGKINLFLDVTGKTANGYHNILTLFLPVRGLEDTLTVSESSQLEIVCSHPGVPANSSNLCWKAAELFAEAADMKPQWKIVIDKKLPVAGGMGGGSSNAGRLLSLLQLNYSGKVSDQQLQEAALSIGADVPFFLNPLPSIASGVGEKLKPLSSLRKIPVLLISFSFPISAAWAYQNRKLPFANSKITAETLEKCWENNELGKIIYNDLGFAVQHKFPIIDGAVKDLKKAGAVNAIVSGSGPTVFGVFDDENSRDIALEKMLSEGYPKDTLTAASAG